MEENEKRIENVIELNEIAKTVEEKITKRVQIILELCTEFFVSKT